MHDIETLRDCLIVDEIERIKALAWEDIVRELVSVNTKKIEFSSVEELLEMCKHKNDN